LIGISETNRKPFICVLFVSGALLIYVLKCDEQPDKQKGGGRSLLCTKSVRSGDGKGANLKQAIQK
jgi:hypothetical protein